MSPRVKSRPTRTQQRTRSSYAEFRAQTRNPDWLALGVDPLYSERAGVFWKWATSPTMTTGADTRLFLSEAEQRTLSKASSAAGGYLVPVDLYGEIMEVRRQSSTIGVLARQIDTADGATINVATATAHGTGSWVSENSSVSASDETFGQVAIGAFKAATKVIVSEELLADNGTELDRYLADELGLRLAVVEDAAFAVGDGSGKPLGIAHTSSGYSVATAAVGSTTGFTAADIATAVAALPVAYLPRATWVLSPTAFRSLAGLGDAGGRTFPSLHAAEPTLYARPVVIASDMPTSTASARSVFFGDLQQAYAVRHVAGIGVQRQDELHSDNGQIGYRAFERVDGRPMLLEAGIILRHSAT